MPIATTAPTFDLVVIGAGAAGLFCAGVAGQRGASVLLIDHADKVAEKVRISGGGRCNFTNRDTTPANFISANPQFCRSALARYKPADFLALIERHRIAWHEKHKGQLFCDESSEDIVAMLLRECEKGRVTRWQPCEVTQVQAMPRPAPTNLPRPMRATRVGSDAPEGMPPGAQMDAEPADAGFRISTTRGEVRASQLVIATGGLSIPKIGASDFGYRIARQFGHSIVPTRPALVPLMFDPVTWAPFAGLAGLSLEAGVSTGEGAGRAAFIEDLLLTHRGLSGPAVLQISSSWQPGTDIVIDLSPRADLEAALLRAKNESRRKLTGVLGALLPARLAEAWLAYTPELASRFIAEVPDRALRELAARLHGWRLRPSNTEGYRKAEVTAGGVDTRELSSQTMESRLQPGLHFIGEVVDVTGWLGGYNFQWAWASAMACGLACALACRSSCATADAHGYNSALHESTRSR